MITKRSIVIGPSIVTTFRIFHAISYYAFSKNLTFLSTDFNYFRPLPLPSQFVKLGVVNDFDTIFNKLQNPRILYLLLGELINKDFSIECLNS